MQPIPSSDPYTRICPVCLQVTGGSGEATTVTSKGFTCCDIHAPVVEEYGLERAVVLVKRSLGMAT